jgi:nucleoside-diphosphate-sugar epimerase
MADALIGHTGFVGGNLAVQHSFAACFNSKNIEAIRGQSFETLVISGMPAAKWIANRDAAGDRAVLERLWDNVSCCRAQRVVVISTVDVYPAPIGVDEDTPIDSVCQQPYGRHRLELEHRVEQHFDQVLVVRLPGLFGPGLKKNAVYDLMHNNEVHKIHPAAEYQFYDVNRLCRDIATAWDAGLSLVNLATEPVSMREVATRVFGATLVEHTSILAKYDVRSRHAERFSGHGGYLESREQVIAGLRSFVAAGRTGVAA